VLQEEAARLSGLFTYLVCPEAMICQPLTMLMRNKKRSVFYEYYHHERWNVDLQ
jgi:hypothetical protein